MDNIFLNNKIHYNSNVLIANDISKILTVEILYHLPDYPSLLQTFVWQMEDLSPTYPNLDKFLLYWEKEIIAKINSVRVAVGDEIYNREFKNLRDIIKI